MSDYGKIFIEIEDTKDKVWDAMMAVHNITPLEDDEHLQSATEHLDLAFSALCRELEKQEDLHGKEWDTAIGDY